MVAPVQAAAPEAVAATRIRRARVAAAYLLGIGLAGALAAVHLTQGTAAVGAAELLRLVTGGGGDGTADILLASRVPRLLAGVTVGMALGVAGAVQVVPVALALLLLTPVVVRARRELDLLTLDDDTPRLLGVRLERTRLVALAAAALLTATAVVSLADTLGRTVIALAQIPAGLVTAMVGAPYFVWLLWRTRGPVVAR